MKERDNMICRPELPLEWTDLRPEDAKAHILGGGSCLISGPAGSGKSTLVKSIVQELTERKQIVLLSKTPAAAANT